MIRGKYRTYILINKNLARGKSAAAVAQAVLKLVQKHNGESSLKRWAISDYNKVICSVTSEQMKMAKERDAEHVSIYDKAIGTGEVATIFVPKKMWSKFFTFLPLYGSDKKKARGKRPAKTANYGGMGGYDL